MLSYSSNRAKHFSFPQLFLLVSNTAFPTSMNRNALALLEKFRATNIWPTTSGSQPRNFTRSISHILDNQGGARCVPEKGKEKGRRAARITLQKYQVHRALTVLLQNPSVVTVADQIFTDHGPGCPLFPVSSQYGRRMVQCQATVDVPDW